MNQARNLSGYLRIVLIALAASAWCGINFAQDGRAAYDKTCSTCHAKGLAGAPRAGDSAAWQARLSKNGFSGLFDSAIKGKGAMPAKGGNVALSEDEVMSAVMHMLRLASVGVGGASSTAPVSDVSAPAAKAAKTADVGSGQGRSTYQATCSACHATGIAGAPKLGDMAAWRPRIGAGLAALQTSALKGKGAMPAKGGNANLTDAEVKAAVDFMVTQARGASTIAEAKPDVPKSAPAASSGARGQSIYQATCVACHAAGVAGAPKVGDATAWNERVKAGRNALYLSAGKGKGAMPAKGGNSTLSDEDVKAAVDFMLAQVGGAAAASATPTAKPAGEQATAIVVPQVVEPIAPRVTAPASAASNVNAFNRLLQAPGKRNLPPLEDGIHDVTNEATGLLQAPLLAYAGLPKSNAGNRIDWVKALNDKQVAPRADKQDAKAEMAVLELNIVREVKGSMPDVVYPHRQHTQWLDCSNCHPAIFIPQKGANQLSMAAIILGQKCGVCHGKVAFPISECRLCHSKAKDPATVTTGVKP